MFNRKKIKVTAKNRVEVGYFQTVLVCWFFYYNALTDMINEAFNETIYHVNTMFPTDLPPLNEFF